MVRAQVERLSLQSKDANAIRRASAVVREQIIVKAVEPDSPAAKAGVEADWRVGGVASFLDNARRRRGVAAASRPSIDEAPWRNCGATPQRLRGASATKVHRGEATHERDRPRRHVRPPSISRLNRPSNISRPGDRFTLRRARRR